MTASWVAASVRARAMSRRRLGAHAARVLASRPDLASAVEELSQTPYGTVVRAGQDLAAAQHAVAATMLWHLRVMGGWVPRGDALVLRVLAGGFEIANTDEHLRDLAGEAAEPPFRLGSLSSAWSRIAAAPTVPAVREALSRSVWGDPGADTPAAIHLAMRLSWAARVSVLVPEARDWAAGAAALVVARETLLAHRRPPPPAARLADTLLGTGWAGAASLTALAATLPREARWALEPARDDGDLWRAEAGWWRRLNRDGFALLHRPLTTPQPVLGAVAVLAADAWRVRAALEAAARGGDSAGAREAFDAVA